MTDVAKVKGLHRRLTDERRRVIDAAANADMLPPAGLLAHLSDIDTAIVAVEAFLEGRTSFEVSSLLVGGDRIGAPDDTDGAANRMDASNLCECAGSSASA